MSEAALSDEQIRNRMVEFEAEEFPPDDCIFYAEYLADHNQGAVAEEAVQRLVDHFPEDRLCELVKKHVAPALSPNCARGPWNALAYALKDLKGIQAAHSTTGWTVSWPGGDAIEGENLCRLALRAVWLKEMRGRGSS